MRPWDTSKAAECSTEAPRDDANGGWDTGRHGAERAHMSSEHVVRENEHAPGIAARNGFSSFKTLWHHPRNAELRKLRQNPNVLFAGDRLFIPDREVKEEARATDLRHRFVLATELLELHVRIFDHGFRSLRGAATLAVGLEKTQMAQKGEVFEAPLRPDVESAVLAFPISETERQRRSIPVEPGRLDPIDTLPGQQQRLNNLGYFAGFARTRATDPKQVDLQFRWAVEEFQCDHMGPSQVDGVLGPRTLKKLQEVYGC
jgi:hypothetical protein